MRRRPLLAGLAAHALAALAPAARAQAFPARPLRLIVPFAPGGLNDVLARQAAEGLKPSLQQAVVVDNRAGASGHLGAELAARAPADGYTLVLLATLHAAGRAYSPESVRYDLFRDFVPVGMLGTSPSMLVARKDLGLRNVRDLVEAAKRRPGELSLAVVGMYLGEFLEAVADIDLNLVMYRGAGAAVNDLLGANVDLMTGTASDMLQLVRTGKFVPLGVSGTATLPGLPDVRPIVETLPAYRGGQAYGLYAPAGTPAAVLARLRGALQAAVAAPDYQARLQHLLVSAPDRTPDELLRDLRESADAFGRARARRASRKT